MFCDCAAIQVTEAEENTRYRKRRENPTKPTQIVSK
jgi:hypothetical protein